MSRRDGDWDCPNCNDMNFASRHVGTQFCVQGLSLTSPHRLFALFSLAGNAALQKLEARRENLEEEDSQLGNTLNLETGIARNATITILQAVKCAGNAMLPSQVELE